MRGLTVRGLAVALAVVLSSLSACDTESPSTGSRTPPPSNAEEDAVYLVDQMEELHPDLFHGVSRSRFRRAADRFVARADELSDEEFLVEAMRIVALPTLAGRDGHTGLFPTHAGVPLHSYPLRLYDFSDGLFVVDALPPYQSLVGAEVTGVAGTSVADLRRTIHPLTTRDNASSLRARFPTMVTTAEVLVGSGIVESERARFRFARDGRLFARVLDPIPMEEYGEWAGGHHLMSTLPPDPGVLYLSRLDTSQWAKFLPRENLLYLQYNVVEQPHELIAAVDRYADRKGIRVVVDVRHNPGGDNTEYAGLVAALAGSRADRSRSLFLVAGRATFSAAGNFVADLLQETDAISVGEPSGGSPNQYGDAQAIELPNSGITAHVAVYYVEVVPGEERPSVPPDFPVRTSSTDYFARRDPVLEAILRL